MEKRKLTFVFENPNTREALERLLLKTLIDKLATRKGGAAGGSSQ